MHPDDLKALERGRPRLLERALRAQALQFRADPSVGRGGCIVESELGTVDARLPVQLEAIERALRGRLDGPSRTQPGSACARRRTADAEPHGAAAHRRPRDRAHGSGATRHRSRGSRRRAGRNRATRGRPGPPARYRRGSARRSGRLPRRKVVLLPLGSAHGIGPASIVRPLGRPFTIQVGAALLGRVLDAYGVPIDGGPSQASLLPSFCPAPSSATRPSRCAVAASTKRCPWVCGPSMAA